MLGLDGIHQVAEYEKPSGQRKCGRNITYALLSVQKSVVDELSGSQDDIFSHSPL